MEPTKLKPEIGTAGDGNLTAQLEYIRSRYNIPAIAALSIRDGEIVEMGAVGVRVYGYSEEVTTDDKWHIGSNTKSMTSTLAAVLVEQGAISWDTTIAGVFPDLVGTIRSGYETVRLDELLSHTSGLNDDLLDDEFLQVAHSASAPLPVQRRAVVDAALTMGNSVARGTWEYSNVGYIVAGAMLEKATRKSWDELIQTHLFTPLQMTSTGFGVPGTADQRNQPWGHVRLGAGWSPFSPDHEYADDPQVMGPAGTIHTTLSDMALYLSAHLSGALGNDNLVTAGSYIKLHTPMPGTTYALGWGVESDGAVLVHSGSNGRWFANMGLFPELNGAFSTATNAGAGGGAEALAELDQILLERFRAAFGTEN